MRVNPISPMSPVKFTTRRVETPFNALLRDISKKALVR
jgi:hypothetical protein